MKFFFCIFCIILFISKTENVFSENLIYDVNNVQVKGKINNSFRSRKIIESAFQKAFVIFVDKTLLRQDAISLHRTESQIIKDLVLGYQIIKKEKNKKNDSFSTLNIKFDPKKINNFLAKRGISYADISNISVTILPVLVKEKNILLYGENFFYKNWVELVDTEKSRSDKLINYNMALENIEDLEYINKIKEQIDSISIREINSFNDDGNNVLLILYSTGKKFKAFIKTSIKNKKIDRNMDLNFYPKDEDRSYKEAIVTLKNEINQIWKEQNLIDVNTPSFLDFFLETKKIDDYLKFKSILNTIDVIENYSVLEMTKDYSKIRLKYRGKVNKIKEKLIEKGIKVQIINNVWKLII
tara:strand:+ start:138 stop:1202 length:1065 start_codon:yes stop_codon:yes gene_type:complete